MSNGPISGISSNYVQSVLRSAFQDAGLTTNKNNSTKAVAQQPDNGRLSPFAQVMSTLQQLQQTDPAKYQQVTQQIATNLQSAAQTAQTEGNPTAAAQLNQLASDFTDASKNSQLPNVQDLAKAIGGGHHRHHHAHVDADAGSATGSASSGGTPASQTLSQLLAAFQTDGTQSAATDPMSIITDTLSSAGITVSNS